ncbi:MAG: holo-ACP synthase [Treponema sp.]|nr:holo-ACP synthase [Treponema sp.]
MIFGIGCDIAKVSRFERWVKNPELLERFFNREEHAKGTSVSMQRLSEYYAVRFAAKEAFSKALGTGLSGFSLRDVYVAKDELNRPSLAVTGGAWSLLCERAGENPLVQVSLSHEKEYALAFVVIEKGVGGKNGARR